jgi:uncharacterized protein (DUF433 family)
MKRNQSKYKELGKFVVSDPNICHGKLTFKGTRVMVEVVLAALAQGMTKEEILKNWPTLPGWKAVEEAQLLAVKTLIKNFPGGPQPWHDKVELEAQKEWLQEEIEDNI